MIERKLVRIGLSLDEHLLKRCDATIPLADVRSRSEFISNAIDYYITTINLENDSRLIIPALDSAMDGRMRHTESRISRIIFKLAVEMSMMMHVVAGTNDIPEEKLTALRNLCTDEVARLNGRYCFEDAVKFQS